MDNFKDFFCGCELQKMKSLVTMRQWPVKESHSLPGKELGFVRG